MMLRTTMMMLLLPPMKLKTPVLDASAA